MNVEQFLAFNTTRPDGEKWELIEGELFLNAAPAYPHQIIVSNLIFHLRAALRTAGEFSVIPGIGVQLSDISAVEPDVMIRRRDGFRGNLCDDIVAAFEVLSPSTRQNDLEFKRLGYMGLTRLTHYVVIAPEQIEVRVFSRGAAWRERRLTGLEETIRFEILGVALSVADIYDDMNDLLRQPET